MKISRRQFLRYSVVAAGAIGLSASGLVKLETALAADGGPQVIWLQGQGCTGCSVSLLNTIYHMSIDDLLLNTVDMKFNSTVMAASGDLAVSAANAAQTQGGYILVVEGAIPTNDGGKYCHVWPGMTALNAVSIFSRWSSYVLAVGTCATYGGIPRGNPNPTGARGVRDIVEGGTVIELPGCPTHPDWIVGTIAHILANGTAPKLGHGKRPEAFYGKDKLHKSCPRYQDYENDVYARELGQPGCYEKLGCRGKETFADCPSRQWNSPAQGEYGVNWCIGAGSPCHGCTERDFSKESRFYTLEKGRQESEDHKEHDDDAAIQEPEHATRELAAVSA